jgi:RNA polymerase sigma factor (sigma-70 family)
MSTTTDSDARDRADMEKLQSGNDAALNDLMERHATPVFHFLCRLTGHEDDANDLAQETFVRVFKSRGSYRSGEKFSTWLFTIAANLARNHFRWRTRHPNVSMDAESPETGQTVGSTLPGGSRARRRSAPGRANAARGNARGDCVVRMAGAQRGRSRGDLGNHAQGGGIPALPRPADFAPAAERLVVNVGLKAKKPHQLNGGHDGYAKGLSQHNIRIKDNRHARRLPER